MEVPYPGCMQLAFKWWVTGPKVAVHSRKDKLEEDSMQQDMEHLKNMGVQHNTRVRFTFYTTHRPVPHKQTLSCFIL